MGYFILITVLILTSYYVWALFFNKPNKRGIDIEEKDEDSIQYTFDRPIEVSEKLIFRQEGVASEKDVATDKKVAIKEPFDEVDTTSSSGERLSKLINRDQAKEFCDKVFGFFKDVQTPSSVFSGEVEYIAFAPLDLNQAFSEGYSKFAHIKIT